jgi:hypothetical protein
MYRLEREEFLKSPLIYLWSILGFQAGFINSFGFLACGRYVSHVTGFGTQIGIALGESKWWLAVELLGFPLSFVLGAFFSGLFTSARMENGLKPRYDLITLFLPTLIGIVLYLGWKGLFGDFGEPLVGARDFILLFSLSFACGVQNGCFATLTKGQIRTTHLTGISTDIGTDFARLFFGKLSAIEKRLVIRSNVSRIATFASFSVGSILSVITSEKIHYLALAVPLVSSVMIFASVIYVGRLISAPNRMNALAIN